MFLQVTIYWGLVGLLALVVVIWQGYRCLLHTGKGDALALGVLGIAVSALLLMPFISELYYKGFSLCLGILVAYDRWSLSSDAIPSERR
jgi:hypothetical protein